MEFIEGMELKHKFTGRIATIIWVSLGGHVVFTLSGSKGHFTVLESNAHYMFELQ